MTESVLVERRDGKLVLTWDGRETAPGARTLLNDEQLHTVLVRQGYIRVGPSRDGDPIAGLYVRKVAA